jgi:hypothetical protein
MLCRITSDLIDEGQQVVGTKFESHYLGRPKYVELQAFHRWWAKVNSLARQLGTAAAPWRDALARHPVANSLAIALETLGTLQGILYELQHDHLRTFTSIVRAETLADLLEQAEHLFNAGYTLAAGVIGRAVLEEHLRTTCDALGCLPDKATSLL